MVSYLCLESIKSLFSERFLIERFLGHVIDHMSQIKYILTGLVSFYALIVKEEQLAELEDEDV